MAEGPETAKRARSEQRQRRLAAELRANLGKRKAQLRARVASADRAPREDKDPPGDS